MYHPPSKQKELAMRFFVYGLMTVAVLAGVAVLIFVMLGFRFDTKGNIEQAGFIQYITTPTQATVEVDGKALSPKTPTRNSVLPGRHEFVMWREGYETWRKTLNVGAGTLTWLNYARLVPKSLPIEPVKILPSLSASLASPQGHYVIAQTNPSATAFVLFDLRNDTAVTQTTLQLPASSYTDAGKPDVVHDFKFIEWDQSSRYILVRHTYNAASEWLIVDRQDIAQTKNITTSLSLAIDDAHLSGTSGNIVYAHSGGDIRKLDLSNGTISRPLVSNVEQFNLYGTDVVSYVSLQDPKTKQRTVGIVRDGDKSPITLRTIAAADATNPVRIATTHYFNQDYVAISVGAKIDILQGSYPSSQDDLTTLTPYASLTASQPVDQLFMNDDGRFVMAQTDDHFTSYDLERRTQAPETTLAGSGPSRRLHWLDNYSIWSDRSGQLTIREFDGANQHTINAVATGFDVTLNQSGKYLYSIGKTDVGYQLQRVKMILQ